MTLDSDISEHHDCFESARLVLFTFTCYGLRRHVKHVSPALTISPSFLFYSGRSQYDVCCFIGSAYDA